MDNCRRYRLEQYGHILLKDYDCMLAKKELKQIAKAIAVEIQESYHTDVEIKVEK